MKSSSVVDEKIGKKCKQNDRPQKLAAKWFLENNGYENVKIISVGSDIVCTKGGVEYRVEVKGADSENDGKRRGIDINYFGAATHTEIMQAIKYKDAYLWLFAFRADDIPENATNYEIGWKFVTYSTEKLIAHLNMPPIKFYIDLPAINSTKTKRNKRKKETKSINNLTMEKTIKICEAWSSLVEEQKC